MMEATTAKGPKIEREEQTPDNSDLRVAEPVEDVEGGEAEGEHEARSPVDAGARVHNHSAAPGLAGAPRAVVLRVVSNTR